MASSPDAWAAYRRLKSIEAELKQGVRPLELRRQGEVLKHYAALQRGQVSPIDERMLNPDWASKAFEALRARWKKQFDICRRFEAEEG